MRSTEDRYRTLLDASSSFADQPTLKAVLHSLRDVLSGTSRLHGTELYVLNDAQDSLRVLEFDRDPDAPAFKIGTKVSRIGAAAQVLGEQIPVFIPDVSQEMLKHPELAPYAAESVGRSTYLFPVSTAQKRYGFLAVTKLQGEEFAPEDVEMLRSLASHVAVALECALARDTAELYHREVVKQRDQLGLLLEINNHIVTKLEVNELFQAVAASMRKHLGTDLTSLWLLNKQTGCLERKFLDFPTGKGILEKVDVAVPTKTHYEWWTHRTPQFSPWADADSTSALREAVIAESLLSRVI